MASEDFDHLLSPCSAGDIKKNNYVLIKGHPCKIVELNCFKNGKHGHAKVTMTGIDVLNGNKYEDSKPSHVQMHFAEIEKKVYQLLHADLENQTVQLLDGKEQVEMQLDRASGWECVEEALDALETRSDDDIDFDNKKKNKGGDADANEAELQLTIVTAPTMTGSKIKKAFAVVECRPLRK